MLMIIENVMFDNQTHILLAHKLTLTKYDITEYLKCFASTRNDKIVFDVSFG